VGTPLFNKIQIEQC